MGRRHFSVTVAVGAAALLVLAGCQHSGPDMSLLEPAVCNTGAYGLKLHLPKGWRRSTGDLGGLAFQAQAPAADTASGHRFLANLGIFVGPAVSARLDPQVIAGLKRGFRSRFKGYKQVGDQDITVNGLLGHTFEYTMQNGPTTLRIRQLFLLRRRKAFVVSLGASAQSWDKYDKVFTACLQSVEF